MISIDKILSLSPAHITRDTAQLLHREYDCGNLNLLVYQLTAGSEKIGLLVYFLPNMRTDHMPQDLRDCVHLAEDLGCTAVCFDRDAEIVPYLQQYNT